VTRLGVDVIGNDGLYVEPVRPSNSSNEAPGIPEEILPVVPEYLNGRAYTIFGGSSEIQREIVAKMVLGFSSFTRPPCRAGRARATRGRGGVKVSPRPAVFALRDLSPTRSPHSLRSMWPTPAPSRGR
jgi:hypothetical protein